LANVTPAAKKTIGHDCKMDTLLAEGITKRGGEVTSAAPNAMGATLREAANSGCLASV